MREEQQPARLYTPQYGRIEIRCRATDDPEAMVALWMFGYDGASKTYHLFMTNNWGEAYEHTAAWTDASSVAFVHSATRDGSSSIS